jgi:hypothetical protein
MKYMIMTFGEASTMLETADPEWIRGMIRFMTDLDDQLRDTGELILAEGLTDGRHAKTVRFVDGMPVATDGPFTESNTSLVGFWIVDVESERRALDIAAQIVDVVHQGIEVRRVADAPPEV